MKKKVYISCFVIIIFFVLSIISWPVRVSQRFPAIGWNWNSTDSSEVKVFIQVDGTYYWSFLRSDSFVGKIRIPYAKFKDAVGEYRMDEITFSTIRGSKRGHIAFFSPRSYEGIITGHLWMKGIFEEFFIDCYDGYIVAAPASSLEEAIKIKDELFTVGS